MSDRSLRVIGTAVAVLLATAAFNCAAFNRRNTPIVGIVEKHMVPEKMPAKALAAPVYIPIGMVGGLVDVFVVHPVMEMPAAWEDVVDLFWTGDAGYVTAMGSLPVRAVASPVFFALDVLARSAFDFHTEESTQPPEPQGSLAELADKKDFAAIERVLSSRAIEPADNPALLRIFEITDSESNVHSAVLMRMGEKPLFPLNEAYLISRLGKSNADDLLIASILLEQKSRKGGRALLNQLAAGRSNAVSSHFIQTILQYDDPELTQALLSRIRTGKE